MGSVLDLDARDPGSKPGRICILPLGKTPSRGAFLTELYEKLLKNCQLNLKKCSGVALDGVEGL